MKKRTCVKKSKDFKELELSIDEGRRNFCKFLAASIIIPSMLPISDPFSNFTEEAEGCDILLTAAAIASIISTLLAIYTFFNEGDDVMPTIEIKELNINVQCVGCLSCIECSVSYPDEPTDSEARDFLEICPVIGY